LSSRFAPNKTSYREIFLRYYIKPSIDYGFGAEKMMTINSTPAGWGGISVGGSGSPFGNGAFDMCPVYDCNILGYGNPLSPHTWGYLSQNTGANLLLKDYLGHWVFVEMHIRMNTPGVQDGIWQLWLNDCGTDGLGCQGTPTLRSNYNNVRWQGPTENKLISSVWFENWANPPSVGETHYDQIIISKTGPIGFMDGVPQPAPDTAAPAVAILSPANGAVVARLR
jgi:hypothetical protein